jgi:ribonuclease BN (tRNA processing enzyme)
VQALRILEPGTPGLDGLLAAFDRMIDRQVEIVAQVERHGRSKSRTPAAVPRAVAAAARSAARRRVRESSLPGGVPTATRELVQWVAARVSHREVFEALLQPAGDRPSQHHLAHMQLEPETLADGESLAARPSAFWPSRGPARRSRRGRRARSIGGSSVIGTRPQTVLKTSYCNLRNHRASYLETVLQREQLAGVANGCRGRARERLGNARRRRAVAPRPVAARWGREQQRQERRTCGGMNARHRLGARRQWHRGDTLSGMQLTVLGSGTAIPVADRFSRGYLLEFGDTKLMVDCGPGTLRRLAAAGVSLDRLDAVLLTHYHNRSLRRPRRVAVRAAFAALRGPRSDAHLRGSGARAAHRQADRSLALARAARLRAAAHGDHAEVVRARHRKRRGHSIRHTAQSLGYRIETDAGTVAFSGDADECDELVELAQDVDVFVCDAATAGWPENSTVISHRDSPPITRSGARSRRLMLTHFYPECEGHDLRAMASARFQGEVLLAADLVATEVSRLA